MASFFAQLIPLAFVLIPFGLFFVLIKIWEWESKNQKRKNPLTSDLLRGPGEALREKLSELQLDIFADVVFMTFMPLLIFAMALSMEVYGHKANSLFLNFVFGLIIVAIICFLLFRIHKNKKKIQKLNLGLDAELAVGQELNQLMRDGYWVYHDFPADTFNIDHVLIGPSGVFAVETKGRAKPLNKNGSVECEVIYDGDCLQFPNLKDDKPLKQAEIQAKWLEKWLLSAVGEPVSVTPVIALPGWFIRRTHQKGIPVINGKNSGAFFSKFEATLSEKLQRQIVHQIDSRCRNILPRAYQPIK
jgi:hypothetical protein